MVTRAVQLFVAVFVLCVASGCSEEKATIVDLDAVTSTTLATTSTPALSTPSTDATGSAITMPPMSDQVDPDDPNGEARQQVIDAARQQCLDDPDLAEGVVRLVAVDTGEVASEYRVDCAEVRSDASD